MTVNGSGVAWACSLPPASRSHILPYQIGTLITTGSLGAGFLPGLIVILIIVCAVVSLIRRSGRHLEAEYALSAQA